MNLRQYMTRLHFQILAPLSAVLFLFMLAIGFVSWVIASQFTSLQDRISASTSATRSVLEVMHLRNRAKEVILLFRITLDPKYVDELEEIEKQRLKEEEILKALVRTLDSNEILNESIFAGGKETAELRQRIVNAVSRGEDERAERLFKDYTILYSINSARLTDVHSIVRSKLNLAEAKIRRLLKTLFFMLISLLGAGAVLGGAMARFYRSRLLRPLGLLHDGLQAVAAGRLGRMIGMVPAPVEVREMLSDFNVMTIALRNATDDLNEAREQAMRAASVKSEFLSNMSHEIRTPLNVIVGVSDLISRRKGARLSETEVTVLKKSSEMLLNVVNDILDYSRLESGKVTLCEETFNLRQSIAGVAAVSEALSRVKGLSLVVSIDEKLPQFVVGDSQRLEQVLLNLVNNAIKFTSQGRVEIDARLRGEGAEAKIEVTVRDTGIGISPEAVGDIFSRFVQADSSITRAHGGTGLGLAIVKQIVALMNGEIDVKSRLGEGSSFIVRIPQRLPASVPAGEELRAFTIDSGESELAIPPETRILLVDDSVDNRFLIHTYLKKYKVSVQEAQNGAEAVEAFRKGGFDAVLMDIQMPVMDGYQATREIRRLEAEAGLKRTPVIALTAFALKEEIERSHAAGCDGHLIKPILKRNLLAELRLRLQINADETLSSMTSTIEA